MPVVTDQEKNLSFVPELNDSNPVNLEVSPQKTPIERRSKANRNPNKDFPLEMIDNSLTVKIEDDLFKTTGKGVSNIANRYSYQQANQASPTKI